METSRKNPFISEQEGEVVATDEVNLDLDRAGSPVQHRRHRLRAPPMSLDEDAAATGVPAMLPPPAIAAASAQHRATNSSGAASTNADEDIAFSLQVSSDDDEVRANRVGAGPRHAERDARSRTPSSSGEEVRDVADTSLPASLAEVTMRAAEQSLAHPCDGATCEAVRLTTRAPLGSVHNSIMSVPEILKGGTGGLGGGVTASARTFARAGEEETPSCDGAYSPAPVTVLGVAQDLRRKRVKKVSHYILGPLLGEGTFGVVRDAINVSADQKRFSRCAIKMIASVVSNTSLANAGNDSALDCCSSRTDGGRRRGGRRGQMRSDSQSASQAARTTDLNEVNVTEPYTEASAANATLSGDTGERTTSAVANEKDNTSAPRLEPWNAKGLTRDRDVRKAQEALVFQNEINNLQRFHCKNVIRAIDVFSRYGKEYVVMPIAICSLQQFVRASILLMREQEAFDRAQGHQGERQTPTPSPAGALPFFTPRAAEMRGESPIWGERASSASSGSGLIATSSAPQVSAESSTQTPLEVICNSPSAVMGPPPALVASASSWRGGVSPSPIGTTLASRLVHEQWNPAQHYLRDGALFSPILTKGFLYQLLAGVAYLHAQRMAHNDIKPSNLLLFEDGSVKLTDLGSIGATYSGQGTPLYASPELCKHYYGMCADDQDDTVTRREAVHDAQGKGSQARGDAGQGEPNSFESAVVDPFANDMWCCGLVLYYLITGQPGPLPVHALYHRYHEAHKQMEEEGALHPSCHMTRWSLYREIASQKDPVNLDNVPDLIIESSHHTSTNNGRAGTSTHVGESNSRDDSQQGRPEDASSTSKTVYPPNGARDLLSRLLAIDPATRITAEAALQHPWVRMTFKPSKKKKEEMARQEAGPTAAAVDGYGDRTAPHPDPEDDSHVAATSTTGLKKPPSKRAMEDAIQRDVARRVLQSRHVKAMILLDHQRHLQFAADCCQILGVPLPREIFRDRGTEPFEDEAHLDVLVLPDATVPDGQGSASAPFSTSKADARGVCVPYGAPEVMPEGCVDTSLFLPPEEYDYYKQKSGKDEFDVVVLRHQPMKVRQMEEYLHNVVLVKCGYRTKEDPHFAAGTRSAKGAPSKSLNPAGHTSSGGAGSSSSSGTFVIRPGGSSSYTGAGIGSGGVSVFSTNSRTLTQLQQQQQQQPSPPHGTVGSAKGVVAREESSQDESPPSTPSASAESEMLPAVTVVQRGGGRASGRQVSSDSLTDSHVTHGGARTPAQRARQSARLSEAEAVLAAQEGHTAIKESSKCLCGLM